LQLVLAAGGQPDEATERNAAAAERSASPTLTPDPQEVFDTPASFRQHARPFIRELHQASSRRANACSGPESLANLPEPNLEEWPQWPPPSAMSTA